MNMTLRPGEALVWRWGHLTPPKYMLAAEQPDYPDIICNGLWEYRPDFTQRPLEEGRDHDREHRQRPGRASAPKKARRARSSGRCGAPTTSSAGRFEVEGNGAVLEVSEDGKKWVSTGKDATGKGVEYYFFSNWGSQRFHYQLRCQLSGDARLKRLAAINDLQMALLALPEMVVGKNAFTYTDQSPGERKVRITHEWVERSTSRPPRPPEAVYPPDGGQAEGTDFAFRWNVPQEADGEKIADCPLRALR